MRLEGKRIGVAVTGSFCTYQKIFLQIQKLVEAGAEVQTIFSAAAAGMDSRFGKAEDFLKRAEEITGKKPFQTILESERIGPTAMFDVLVIMPCTGNTLAKLANGITDGAVLMAAKAHLRNERPVVLCIASNDALGMNMKNIGLLLNAKHIYFVPFSQDDPVKKPNSLVAHTELLLPSVETALEGKQLQPVLAQGR
ncbi:MAG: dipicolinate synthase subunit B [Lachnospiraceae bacterium]|nr:dipicolinate synthase subunit B [Lachnospiraceae bacterium]